MFEIFDEKVQLHQEIRILYMVTHYEATYYTADGNREVCGACGASVFEALQNLEKQKVLQTFDIKTR